jgi:hypothetical protein
MLELLNQLDGFDDRGDVKVIMATNKVSIQGVVVVIVTTDGEYLEYRSSRSTLP